MADDPRPVVEAFAIGWGAMKARVLKAGAMKALVLAALVASAPCALVQPARIGPEWDGKDHQPTQNEAIRLEDRAGVELPPAQSQQNARAVQQLDRQLLHEEAVNPPRDPDLPPVPRPVPLSAPR